MRLFLLAACCFSLLTPALYADASNKEVVKEIAITIDDAPMPDSLLFNGQERTALFIKNLANAGVKEPMLFVTTTYLSYAHANERLDAYSNAGFLLANHSHSHGSPNDMPIDEYIADIDKADALLKDRKNFVPFYRFPFLQHGNTKDKRDKLRQHLAKTGYKIGYVTINDLDWYMNSLLQQALQADKHIDYDVLKKLYIDVMLDAVTFYDNIAVTHLKRSPKHVLLMHENDISALFIGDLIAALKQQNWRTISAKEAFNDPIAAELPDVIMQGQGRVAAIAASQGVSYGEMLSTYEKTDNIDKLFAERKVFLDK